MHSWTHVFTKEWFLTVFGCKVAASGGRLLLFIQICRSNFAPEKDAKGNGMDMLTIRINSIRSISGLLCSSENSKVCFLLHETPFAAQNSLLCRGQWLTSEVGLPVYTCRKQWVINICRTQKQQRWTTRETKAGEIPSWIQQQTVSRWTSHRRNTTSFWPSSSVQECPTRQLSSKRSSSDRLSM